MRFCIHFENTLSTEMFLVSSVLSIRERALSAENFVLLRKTTVSFSLIFSYVIIVDSLAVEASMTILLSQQKVASKISNQHFCLRSMKNVADKKKSRKFNS